MFDQCDNDCAKTYEKLVAHKRSPTRAAGLKPLPAEMSLISQQASEFYARSREQIPASANHNARVGQASKKRTRHDSEQGEFGVQPRDNQPVA